MFILLHVKNNGYKPGMVVHANPIKAKAGFRCPSWATFSLSHIPSPSE